MKLKNLAICFILLIACLTFGACDFSFTQSSQTFEVSGYASINNQKLEGVSIKTRSQTLAKTDENGNFSFTINAKSIEIFAEKPGYIFSPRKVTITQNTNNLNFIAEKIENLNGELVLSSVSISPISITSVPDNYKYTMNSANCLKIKQFNVKISDFSYTNFVPNKSYLEKNTDNTFKTLQEYSIETNSAFSIYFSLSAYFTASGHEYTFNETKQTVLNVSKNKTTADLNDDNQYEVSLYGINSSNNMFSYNITFIFDYYPNI